MPIRYIFPDNQVKKINAATKETIEAMICHAGTPNGSRTNITMGEVNGIIELHTTSEESGVFIAAIPI